MRGCDMNVYVLDQNFNKIAVIDVMSSIIWTNRYYSKGDCEIYLSMSERNLDILRENYYLVREGHETNAMIIRSIKITTDIEVGNYITVTGECLKSLLYRRIIWNVTELNGTLEACINRLLMENAINPTDSKRKMDLINVNTLYTGINISAQYTGTNLGEAISELCQNNGIGWDIELIDGKFHFKLYKGLDRSYDQNDNPPVIFSNEFENLLTTTYVYDLTNFRNVAKVAGEGEGVARRMITVGNASGLDRYELFIDARDISSNNGQIPTADYNKLLTNRGNDKLAERAYTESFEGEVEPNYTYKLGSDYNLGDVVEVVNEYGIAASTRILEIIESEDDTGKYIIPTFSNYIIKEV